MHIKSIMIENFRSFSDKTKINFHDDLNIIVGPNGSGKSNVLDAIMAVYSNLSSKGLIGTFKDEKLLVRSEPISRRNNFQENKFDVNKDVIVSLQITLEQSDINIIDYTYNELLRFSVSNVINEAARFIHIYKNFGNTGLLGDLNITYVNDVLQRNLEDQRWETFVAYMEVKEIIETAELYQRNFISSSILYLSSSRNTHFSFGYRIGSDQQQKISDQKKQYNESKVSGNVPLGVVNSWLGLLRLRAHNEAAEICGTTSEKKFYGNNKVKILRDTYRVLGYDWSYDRIPGDDIIFSGNIKKDGKIIALDKLSTGEQSLLSIVGCMVAMDFDGSVVIIDEPELHLHPRWQKVLLNVINRLSNSYGVQIILVTHSGSFISPKTIGAVTRLARYGSTTVVGSPNKSSIPEIRHLIHIVETQNNERMFFADRVILVEGLRDKLLVESVVKDATEHLGQPLAVEVLEVQGKSLFSHYGKMLRELKVPYAIVADRDYLFEVGSSNIKEFLRPDKTKASRLLRDKKSSDRLKLFDDIAGVLNGECLDDLRSAYEYITSRFVDWTSISPNQRLIIEEEIEALKGKYQVFIWKLGDIEEYIPGMTSDIEMISRMSEDTKWLSNVEIHSRQEFLENVLNAAGMYEATYEKMSAIINLKEIE